MYPFFSNIVWPMTRIQGQKLPKLRKVRNIPTTTCAVRKLMAAIAVLNRKLAEKFYRVHIAGVTRENNCRGDAIQVSNVADRPFFST